MCSHHGPQKLSHVFQVPQLGVDQNAAPEPAPQPLFSVALVVPEAHWGPALPTCRWLPPDSALTATVRPTGWVFLPILQMRKLRPEGKQLTYGFRLDSYLS